MRLDADVRVQGGGTMSTRDGGPAFPVDLMDMDSMGEMRVRYQEPGMSLRDWFAGQALPAVMAAQIEVSKTLGIASQDSLGDAARGAYEVADAMLAAREVG